MKDAPAVNGRGKPAPALLDPLKSTGAANETALAARNDAEAGREPDFIAQTAIEALGDWEPLVEPLLSSFEDLAGDCADLSELQSRLAEALGGMEVSAFTELLARGGFAARITGEAKPG